MKEIYQKLKPLGYVVTASVPAKAYDNPKNSWNGAYDYAALSNYVDTLVLMAYDEHWMGGTPGAIASIGWVEEVLDYSVTVVPRSKLYLGVAAYGYDWASSGSKAYSINGCYNVASKYSATIKWDNTSKTPYFNYTDDKDISHSVWFENGQSLGYKLDLAKSYKIQGIAIWRLGLENTDYWKAIDDKLN
jgi:spore germination protein YaaH